MCISFPLTNNIGIYLIIKLLNDIGKIIYQTWRQSLQEPKLHWCIPRGILGSDFDPRLAEIPLEL